MKVSSVRVLTTNDVETLGFKDYYFAVIGVHDVTFNFNW